MGKVNGEKSGADTKKSASEASKMLEAALLQIDDILSDGEMLSDWKDPTHNLARNLVAAIQRAPSIPPPPDAKTCECLLAWLQPERHRKLEIERNAFHMEISILSEQVEAQSNRIIELDNALQEKKNSLRLIEEALQKEVLLRSTLETEKLELLSSLSEVKLKQASLEHENLALRNTNVERFNRHAGLYCSLPRSRTKKGVIFATEEKTVINENLSYIPVAKKSFIDMTTDDIGEWLTHLGLECYKTDFKRWGATGFQLLETPQNQIEKDLEGKNILHKKKLLYAIESERNNGYGFFGAGKMDNAAVLRWLDDIGLPQHKEAFYNAKVDGRVLHRLTTEDLLLLNVTAQLHSVSLQRGIQVLRKLNFEFDYLERRGSPSEGNVSLWTNHRVMEWLRVVDLAEYAPNLRGSGVHGGLIVYEPRFTSDLLASLLNIPTTKTLLRRHLTTHFNQAVGREVVQQKRETSFVPLTLTARLKVPKKQFTIKRKKSRTERDFGDLICPLEDSSPGSEMERLDVKSNEL